MGGNSVGACTRSGCSSSDGIAMSLFVALDMPAGRRDRGLWLAGFG